jgi:hypothetical protein
VCRADGPGRARRRPRRVHHRDARRARLARRGAVAPGAAPRRGADRRDDGRAGSTRHHRAPLARLPGRRVRAGRPGRGRPPGSRDHGRGAARHRAHVRPGRDDRPRRPQGGLPLGDRGLRQGGQAGRRAGVRHEHPRLERALRGALQRAERLHGGAAAGDPGRRPRGPRRPDRRAARGQAARAALDAQPGAAPGRRRRRGDLPGGDGAGVLPRTRPTRPSGSAGFCPGSDLRSPT